MITISYYLIGSGIFKLSNFTLKLEAGHETGLWNMESQAEYICILFHSVCPTLCNPMDCSFRLFCPRDSPDKNVGVGSYFLLQGIFPAQGLNPCLLHSGRFFTDEPLGKPHQTESDTKETFIMKYTYWTRSTSHLLYFLVYILYFCWNVNFFFLILNFPWFITHLFFTLGYPSLSYFAH